ncbi:MAG: GAF domain-containing protein [Acholeplasma sp.]|nr:GAF domain-containing protein [Acholeplasma sp.]
MNYDDLYKSLSLLIENEKYDISLLANTVAFIYEHVSDLNWVGFYLYKDTQLILGPFQGKVACSTIACGKGVCGTALLQKKTVVVPDVLNHKNHITCDANSRSEIVIPIIIENNVYAVLDIDSPIINRFAKEEIDFFEKIVINIQENLKQIIKY